MRTHPALLLVVGLLLTACDDPTGPAAGSIRVAASTGGIDLDPDGYAVRVDDSPSQAVGINASATFTDVTVGDHDVELTGAAANCVITGANPRTLAVSAGSTATTTFQVTCAGTSVIEVTASTTGIHPDADGYIVTVDGGQARPIGTNGTEVFTGLAAGDHEVELSGVPIDCALDGVNPRTLAVSVGSTVSTTFQVTCAGTSVIEVTASTTGIHPDADGYIVTVDGGESRPIGANGTEVFTGRADGDHEVELSGVAINCALDGVNPRTLAVSAGSTVSTTFKLDCAAAFEGGIAFESSGDIYVMDADDSDPVNLTNTGLANFDPAWSPDGTRIAFASGRGHPTAIYVMNADGSNPVRLTFSGGSSREPAWSPDGTRIAFTESGRIYVMNADGSNVVNLGNVILSNISEYVYHPYFVSLDWSPGGTRIAFSLSEDICCADIYVADADGSNPRNLTRSRSIDDRSPAWSPDGTHIAHSRRQAPGNTSDIYVMDAAGSTVVNLSNNPARDGKPAWSPDGTRIAFESDREDSAFDIYVMDADGANQIRLTDHTGSDRSPAWAP